MAKGAFNHEWKDEDDNGDKNDGKNDEVRGTDREADNCASPSSTCTQYYEDDASVNDDRDDNLDGGGGSPTDLWQSSKEAFSQRELALQFSIMIMMMMMTMLMMILMIAHD